MSETRRNELREEAFAELLGYPASGRRSWIPRAPVKSAGDNVLGDRSWHFFGYSYSRAFDTLWGRCVFAVFGGAQLPALVRMPAQH